MLLSEEGSTLNCKRNCPAWRKPYVDVLKETNSQRLLTVFAATEERSSSTFWDSLQTNMHRAYFAPKLRRVFSSVEKQADRGSSSLARRCGAKNCEHVSPSHTRCTQAS
jgi:hypothetical protein